MYREKNCKMFVSISVFFVNSYIYFFLNAFLSHKINHQLKSAVHANFSYFFHTYRQTNTDMQRRFSNVIYFRGILVGDKKKKKTLTPTE